MGGIVVSSLYQPGRSSDESIVRINRDTSLEDSQAKEIKTRKKFRGPSKSIEFISRRDRMNRNSQEIIIESVELE